MVIEYCYATSSSAVKLGYGNVGCYAVYKDNDYYHRRPLKGFQTKKESVEYVKAQRR
jgi:hypothetical protein